MITIDEKFKKEIGKRIRDLRVKHKYTIEGFVEKLNNDFFLLVDEKTIRRYERGVFLPKIDNLIVLCEFFGVTLDYIVFGKRTSDDNSFTWGDTFKRLNRLIFSCVLFPWKETDKQSAYFDKYYLTGYDDELQLYLDRLVAFAKNKNYGFGVRGKDPTFNVEDLDNLIQEFESYKESLLPTKERLEKVIVSSGGSMVNFEKEKSTK